MCSAAFSYQFSALEFATQGLARATSHRVLSPTGGSGPRYSVPFFQNIGLDVKLTEHVLNCMSLSNFRGEFD
jgi:isopenicillin N synthase-like dioxygenase